MKKYLAVLLVISILTSLCIPVKADDSVEYEYDNTSVIVTLKHEYSFIDKEYTVDDFDCDLISNVKDLTPVNVDNIENSKYNFDGWKKVLQLFLENPSDANIEQAISTLSDNYWIETVERNYQLNMYKNETTSTTAIVNASTSFNGNTYSTESGDISAVINTNDTYVSNQYAISNTMANKAWAITTGSSNITVGIIDSGINQHADLIGNLSTTLNKNFTNESDLADNANHGTKVAGIIGARTNNSLGIAGICWNVTLVNLKAYKDDPFTLSGGTTYMSWITEAINYAASVGIDVINISGSADSLIGRTGLKTAIDNYSGIIVAACGNDGSTDIPYPAGYSADNIISVASINSDNELVSSSNYNYTHVDLAAPGDYVLSSIETSAYSYNYGTSYAAPFVTATVALLLSINPNYTPAEIKDLILENTDSLSSLLGKIATGGKLNIFSTLLAAKGYILGDLDLDGTITAADARLALRISSQLETATNLQKVLTDINFDNYITAADARTILQLSADLA